VVDLSGRRPVSRWVPLLGIAAAFAALLATEGSALVAWVTGEPTDVRTTSSRYEYAARMRQQATKAIEAKQWRRALELLDRAKEADPEGDQKSEAQGLRQDALAGLDAGGAD
jgi:hypothetical protein